MFAKKQLPIQLPVTTSLSSPFNERSLNATHLNHQVNTHLSQFFLLVRDQRYHEAYRLGINILKTNPNNSAVANFCHFIKNNHQGLDQMLDEQQYTDGSDEEDEDDEGSEDGDDDSEDEKQSESSVRGSSSSILSKTISIASSKVQSRSKVGQQKKLTLPSVGKLQGNKQNAYKWEHNCKNPHCPNKNKPHKH